MKRDKRKALKQRQRRGEETRGEEREKKTRRAETIAGHEEKKR